MTSVPFFITLLLCSLTVFANPAKTISMTEVIFQQSETGLEPYLSRLLVNDKFIRLDDGENQGDFILFNRQQKTIQSVNYEEQNLLNINPPVQQKINLKLKFEVQQQDLPDAPAIAGNKPQQNLLLADNKLCQSVINVPGLLPQVQLAMIEYEMVIAAQNAVTLEFTPNEIKTGCYMATNILHRTRYLELGFPLQYQDYLGKTQRLVGYKQVDIPASILFAPESFTIYSPGEMQQN